LHELFSKKRLNKAILTHSQLERALHTLKIRENGSDWKNWNEKSENIFSK